MDKLQKMYTENKEVIHVALAGLVFMVLLYFIINGFKSNRSIESYINEANAILNQMDAAGEALTSFATKYVTTRTGLENEVLGYVQKGNKLLSDVVVYQASSKEAYGMIVTNLSNTTNSASLTTNAANTADTALTNIQNIVNNVTPTPGGNPGNDFGTAISGVEAQNSIAKSAYDSAQTQLATATSSYNSSADAEQTIANNLSYAKADLNQLEDYIVSLTAGIVTSPEYRKLQDAHDKAVRMQTQLTQINNKLTEGSIYKLTIEALIVNIGSSVTAADRYLTNITEVFRLATTDATGPLNGYITQLNTIFSNMLSIVGTLTAGFTEPVTIPTVLYSGEKTILWYYNEVGTIHSAVITQYNITISNFNRITGYVNSINTLTTNVISGINTSANTANTNLAEAALIMQNYFPGSTTPGVLGPYVTPAAPGMFTTVPPVPTVNFQTITPKTLNSIITIASAVNNSNIITINLNILADINISSQGYLILYSSSQVKLIKYYPNAEIPTPNGEYVVGSYKTTFSTNMGTPQTYAFYTNGDSSVRTSITNLTQVSPSFII